MADNSTLIVTNDTNTLVMSGHSTTIVSDTVVDRLVVEVAPLVSVPVVENSTVVTETAGAATVVLGGEPGPEGKPGKSPEPNPTFEYVNSILTRITYPSGNYKLFEYLDGLLHTVTYYEADITTRKTFYYNVDGSLQRIEETTI